MSAPSPIKFERDEFFTPKVDEALARERAMRGRVVPAPPQISLFRRLLFSSMFYLPMAALLGAIATWLLLEPFIEDMPRVAGDVILVNSEPFETTAAVSMTVGNKEVFFLLNKVKLEPGARGQKAFSSLTEIGTGATIEVIGLGLENKEDRVFAVAVRPATEEDARAIQAEEAKKSRVALMVFFPVSATLIALSLLLAESLSARNWIRMLDRGLLGSAMSALFSVLAYIPAGFILLISKKALDSADSGAEIITAGTMPIGVFLTYAACRSAAWACLAAGMGFGMNIIRSTRAQMRNSVVGGALGGALGGLFFDPIDRFVSTSPFDQGGLSRLVGVCAVGLSIGVFVALVERLTREAWIRVRTGPLAGKSFILYKTPTMLGSSPHSDVYLFKDAEIDGHHATIHRVGTAYEIEDMESREGTFVGGREVRRRRLASGDQIILGSTVLEFEERAQRPLIQPEGRQR